MESLSHGELSALVRLHLLPQIGAQRLHLLLNAFGSAASALTAPESAWVALKIPRVSIEQRHSTAISKQVNHVLRWLEHDQHHLLSIQQDEYPALLKEISDPPPLLYVEGNCQILEQPQLAIVGSRNSSRVGLEHAFSFAHYFAQAGGIVTSGLASGADSYAHLGALKAQAQTIAVVGTGLNHTYPRSNKRLRSDIVAQGGAIVSEFTLDTEALAQNFPRRNRIISGLSLGVLVVEASARSGSLITARMALEQGREVFAIPSSIHNANAKGCHQLLREGAVLVESIDDIWHNLQHWQQVIKASSSVACCNYSAHDPLLASLKTCSLTLDDLASLNQMPVSDVLVRLTELELSGCICQENGLWLYRGAQAE